MPDPVKPSDPPHAPAPDPRPRMHPRSLAQAGLDGEPAEVYKHDARSKVWRVEHGTLGPVVVKRFEYTPGRQRVSLIVGTHPGQHELKRNRQLAAAGVPVVPILEAGEERAGFGGRAWLATPLTGTSLQRLLTAPDTSDVQRETLIDDAAELTRQLIAAGFTFKDLKPSNIVVGEHDRLLLIDVGSARPDTSKKQTTRMLAVMDRVLKRDGVSRELRERYRQGISQ